MKLLDDQTIWNTFFNEMPDINSRQEKDLSNMMPGLIAVVKLAAEAAAVAADNMYGCAPAALKIRSLVEDPITTEEDE